MDNNELRENKRLHNNAPLFKTRIFDNFEKCVKFMINYITKSLSMFLKS